MKHTQHVTCNRVLRCPPGVPIEECHPLPVTDILEPDGTYSVASFWLPDAAELALLNAGKPVVLFVMGRTHPPLSVGVATI